MRPLEIISRNIAQNKTLSNKKIYLITQEVHIRSGVQLRIQDGVLIYILNGPITKAKAKRAALHFDQGSALHAGRFTLKAANRDGKPERCADNGGIWFYGNYASATKDGSSVKSNPKKRLSNFVAIELKTFFLGRTDPIAKNRSKKIATKIQNEDLDAISVLGVGPKEWGIQSIKSYYSGDDGFDITNSNIGVDRLCIKKPIEDGLNVSSSRIQLKKSLRIEMGDEGADRDLFDLETDDGGSFIEIHKGCKIHLDGIFGDQLVLSSIDLPPIKPRNKKYIFSGHSKQSDSLIYSITMD
jgi:hypothetical protein